MKKLITVKTRWGGSVRICPVELETIQRKGRVYIRTFNHAGAKVQDKPPYHIDNLKIPAELLNKKNNKLKENL